MTQPANPVPTSQRPLNGLTSGTVAQLVGNYSTSLMLAHGVDPTTATFAGTAVGSGASALLATTGAWARDTLTQIPAGPWWALVKLPVMLLARAG